MKLKREPCKRKISVNLVFFLEDDHAFWPLLASRDLNLVSNFLC